MASKHSKEIRAALEAADEKKGVALQTLLRALAVADVPDSTSIGRLGTGASQVMHSQTIVEQIMISEGAEVFDQGSVRRDTALKMGLRGDLKRPSESQSRANSSLGRFTHVTGPGPRVAGEALQATRSRHFRKQGRLWLSLCEKEGRKG